MADAVVVDTMVASAWLGVRQSDRQARWAPVLEPIDDGAKPGWSREDAEKIKGLEQENP